MQSAKLFLEIFTPLLSSCSKAWWPCTMRTSKTWLCRTWMMKPNIHHHKRCRAPHPGGGQASRERFPFLPLDAQFIYSFGKHLLATKRDLHSCIMRPDTTIVKSANKLVVFPILSWIHGNLYCPEPQHVWPLPQCHWQLLVSWKWQEAAVEMEERVQLWKATRQRQFFSFPGCELLWTLKTSCI